MADISLEELRDFRKEMQFPNSDTSMWVYKFVVDENGDLKKAPGLKDVLDGNTTSEEETQFDFRASHVPHPKDKELVAMTEGDIPEDKDIVMNQIRGDPTIGDGNFFNTMGEAEEKILEVVNGEAEDAIPREEQKKKARERLKEMGDQDNEE